LQISIILGLANAQVLQGVRGLILTRKKVKLYAPTVIWTGMALLVAIQGWWASFSMHEQANWNFLGLLVIVLQAVSVYMIAALVLPDPKGDTVVDLRELILLIGNRVDLALGRLGTRCGVEYSFFSRA